MSRRSVPDSQVVGALLDAYRRGYFPMAEPRPPWNPLVGSHVHWPSPDPRGILPLTPALGFHAPRSLNRRLNSGWFSLRSDTAFEHVMRACATKRKPNPLDHADDDTWIDETLIRWFTLLHRAGHAHSLEAWRTDPADASNHLVGGVYGVSIGAAFFGESMFHRPRPRPLGAPRHPLDGTDASKVCLVSLVRHLAALGYTLFDTQMVTSHVRRFGAVEITRGDYLGRLAAAVALPDRWRSF